MSECQNCGEDLLEDGVYYHDGQIVSCGYCGTRHSVSCDSETDIELDILEEGTK